jgi:hypothetical protein
MIETAMVFNQQGRVLGWHRPDGAGSTQIPDSLDLWEFLWKMRDVLGGVAHSHPGGGALNASWTDVSTFLAVERGLGRRLCWPIVSTQHQSVWYFKALNGGAGRPAFVDEPHWVEALAELRERSRSTTW